MVAIYTSCNMKEEFMKCTGGNMELVIVHVCLFKSILEKCNFHKEQKIVQMLLNNIQKEYDMLKMHTSSCGKKLKQDIGEARKK